MSKRRRKERANPWRELAPWAAIAVNVVRLVWDLTR